MYDIRRHTTTWLAVLVVGLGTFALTGCGGDNGETEIDCENHDQCLDDEACLGDVCTDAPELGDECSDYEGATYEELVCEGGIWVQAGPPPADLVVTTEPPAAVEAGEDFEFAIGLVDENGDEVQRDDIDIEATLSDNEFAAGDDTLVTTTDGGVADFQAAIDEIGSDYTITASSEAEELEGASVTTSAFDVTAAGPNDLAFATQPPEDVTAGESFDVGVRTVHSEEGSMDIGGVDVTLELNQGEFADGESTATELTDSGGLAEFELTVETTDRDLVLTATADHQDLGDVSTNSDSFDVVAAEPAADQSNISGESGIAADGETEAEITIELADEFGNPVPEATPEFEATGDGNDYQDCSESDDDGQSSCAMTSTQPGDKTLEITDPVQVVGQTIEFVFPCDDGADDFSGGEGTADEPYVVCAVGDLNDISDDSQYLDAHFVLARDLDADGGIVEIIGDDDDPFEGEFDGNGRTIEDLTIDEDDTNDVGVFGVLDEDSTVYDLTLDDVDVIGELRVGALAGTADGDIKNVHVSGKVEATDSEAGGLAGIIEGAVTNSTADVDVTADETAGGFAAETDNAEITNSAATGDVTVDNGAGGFVESAYESLIARSYASGDVELLEGNGGGGFIYHLSGQSQGSPQPTTVEDAYSTGDVITDGEWVGGFVGSLTGNIYNCYSAGLVEGEDDAHALGGFAGDVEQGYDAEDTYWDEDTSQMTQNRSNAEALSTGDFDDEANFGDFDFDDTWTIDEAPDGEDRPVLQWQVE